MTTKRQNLDPKTKLGRNALIASSIMAAWVGVICFAAIAVPEPLLLIYTLPYLFALYLSWRMFQGKIKSETSKRVAILYNIVGVGSAIFFVFVYFCFMNNFVGM